MRDYKYSITYEFDSQLPDAERGMVQASSTATAAARSIRKVQESGKGKRAKSVVIVLDLPQAGDDQTDSQADAD